MTYSEFEKVISVPRLQKYLDACNGNTKTAMKLYRSNIRLSQKIFAVMSIFEVVLRNSINTHYKKFKGSNWLADAIDNSTGYLNAPGCEHSLHSINEIIQNLGINYTHDKVLAALSFGFWTFQFGSKEYAAAGNTLLSAFPARPYNTHKKIIFKRLLSINKFRNRIAHHEPICFTAIGTVSTNYVLTKYNQIIELITWLGIDSKRLLFGIDGVRKEIDFINRL
jgi:hypothetical protein